MTYAPRRCARCGRDVPTLMDVAVSAQRARHALDTMKLALPDTLTINLRLVASALACFASICTPQTPRTP